MSQRLPVFTVFLSYLLLAGCQSLEAQRQPEVNTRRSSLEVSSSVARADGKETIAITVTLRDRHDQLITGRQVTIKVTGRGHVLLGPDKPTNLAGTTTALLASSTPGRRRVTAFVASSGSRPIRLRETVQVDFIRSNPKRDHTYYRLAPVEAEGLIAVFSSDLSLLHQTCGPTAKENARYDLLTSLRAKNLLLVGRIRQAPPEGLSIQTPLIYHNQAPTNGNPLGSGTTEQFSAASPGEYQLAGGALYLSDIHSSSSTALGGPPMNCPHCGNMAPEVECSPGNGGSGPTPCGPDMSCPDFDSLGDSETGNFGGIDGACWHECPPSPALCPEGSDPPPIDTADLPFDTEACFGAPPQIAEICTQIDGISSMCPGYCEYGPGGWCYSLDQEASGGTLSLEPECLIGQCAFEEDCPCEPDSDNIEEFLNDPNLPNAVRVLSFRGKYLACLVRPDLEFCQLNKVDLCPTGEGHCPASLIEEENFEFCDNLGDPDLVDRCVLCSAMTGGACLPTGADPTVLADDGGEPPPPAEGEEGGEEPPPEEEAATPESEAKNNSENPPPEKERPPEEEIVEVDSVDDCPPNKWCRVKEGGDTTCTDRWCESDPDGPTYVRPEPEEDEEESDTGGDPVALASGELALTVSDVSFPSRGISFTFERRYRSGGIRSGAFGPGWVHSLEDYIELVGDRFNRNNAPQYCVSDLPVVRCLYHYDSTGGKQLYVFDGVTGLFTPEPGNFNLIRVTRNGFNLRKPGGITHRYNLIGRLESIRDADGYGVDVTWRVRSTNQVEADGNPFRYGITSLLDQPIERFGVAYDGIGQQMFQTGLTSSERINMFSRLELESVTDSYGRVFKFVHKSYPENSGPLLRRRRLSEIQFRGETLVRYDYTWLEETREAYLSRVTRYGLQEGLEQTSPRVTRYEYQHDILQPGGALWVDNEGQAGSVFAQQIFELVSRLQRDVNLCGRLILTLPADFSDMGGTGNPCDEVAPGAFAGGQIAAFSPFQIFGEVKLAIADNIIRVFVGQNEEIPDLETFYEPDPRSPDFDRAVKQRYGVLQTANQLPETEKSPQTEDTLFTWRTKFPQVTFRQVPSGDPSSIPLQMISVSLAVNGPIAESFLAEETGNLESVRAAIGEATEQPTTLSNPDRHSLWFRDKVAVPEEILNSVPLVESVPFVAEFEEEEDEEEEESCQHFDSLRELPKFAPRDPAGTRADRALGADPAIVRTRASCAAIAGRQARDPFKNESATYCGEPGFPGCEEVAIGGQRRNALEWDLARVCRWVQVENRDGRTDYRGLNFHGQSLVSATPAANDDGWQITLRRYNADGLLKFEKRHDGGGTSITYDHQDTGAVNVLYRSNATRIVQAPATSSHLEEPSIEAKIWEYTYEPAFQQLTTVKRPDRSEVQYFYDYQQLRPDLVWIPTVVLPDSWSPPNPFSLLDPNSTPFVPEIAYDLVYSDPGAQLLVQTLSVHGIVLPDYGRNLFLGKDLDGDGTATGEHFSGLVLKFQDKIQLGGGQMSPSGVRYQRDDTGRLVAHSNIQNPDTAASDTDRVEFFYYRDLEAAEAGNFLFGEETCPYPEGPLALERILRHPDSTSPEDMETGLVAYDALGGVRFIRQNDDSETEVFTLRNSLGQVVRRTDQLGLRASFAYDNRGQLVKEVLEDGLELSSPRVSTHAWGYQGVSLGSCTELQEKACQGFQNFARTASLQLLSGENPEILAEASYFVDLHDAEDRLIGQTDATGGHLQLFRNLSGLVEKQVVAAEPSLVTEFHYDEMGRLLSTVIGAGSANPLSTHFQYDGLDRLTGVQNHAPPSITKFNDQYGTVTRTFYDVMDRTLEERVIGGDGHGNRRILSDLRIERNEAGIPLLIHGYSSDDPPSPDSPPLPPSGGNQQRWATQELRYNHTLDTVFNRYEGRSRPVTSEYDGLGLVRVIHPDFTRSIDWNPPARSLIENVSLLDDLGGEALKATYTSLFDGAGQLIERTRQDTTDSESPILPKTTIQYDGLGQIVRQTGEDQRGVVLNYDRAGNMVRLEEFDPSNTIRRTSHFGFDAMGRLIRDAGPSNQVTGWTHDKAGRKTARIQGDAFPEESRITTRYVYDDAGRLETTTRSRLDAPERRIEFEFPQNGVSPERLFIDSQLAQTFSLDGLNRPVSSTDQNLLVAGDGPAELEGLRPSLTTALKFDTMGSVVSERTTADFPAGYPGLSEDTSMDLGQNESLYAADWLCP